MKHITGFNCPSCGATRMSVCFIHGQIRRGFRYNQVLPFILPILAYLIIKFKINYIRFGDEKISKIDEYIMLAIIVTLIVYWIVRNLTIYPYRI